MPGGVRLGAGGWTGRRLPLGKPALGGYGLGGLVRVWLGLVWARYSAPSLPSAAGAVVPAEALGARVGPIPTDGAVRGASARPAGAAAAAPCASAPPPPGRGGRGRGLSGGSGLPGRHGFLGRQLGVVGGCLRLLGRRSDQDRGLCNLPLLALGGGFPRVPRGDGGAGAGPAVVAVVPLGEPSESDIPVILVGMRGCRRVRPTAS